MQRDDEYEGLRALAAIDPRRAREKLCALLDSASPYLETLLLKASSPGDGRLRQLFANTVRVRGEQHRFTAQLMAWREVEADEFARRAIDAALHGTTRQEREAPARPSLVGRGHVEAYRYVSERLRHQLRNGMMDPMGHLIRLRGQADKLDPTARNSLTQHIAALEDALRKIGRIVEFEAGDDHFTIRPVLLADWLPGFNGEYGRKYRPVTLRLENHDQECRILASDYLLGTVFWNLWINSQQAVGIGCAIMVHFGGSASRVDLLLVDNGDGFPKEVAEAGFPDAKPRPGHRGRGLLEVQEAMERLHGEAALVQHDDGSHRIKLSFPKEW
jgi:signal transduction histidine kinase